MFNFSKVCIFLFYLILNNLNDNENFIQSAQLQTILLSNSNTLCFCANFKIKIGLKK